MSLAVLSFAACAAAYTPVPPTPQMYVDAATIIAAATVGAGNSTAWDRLAYATDTFGPRLSGSQALNDFIDWVATTASTVDGLKVTKEPVQVPHWVRGTEWAILESPRAKTLHFCGAGYSNSTQGAPVTAPVLVVGSNEELMNRTAEAKGKIILFDWPTWEGYGTTVAFRYNAAAWAAAAGGVAALFKSITPWGLQTCHTGVSAPGPVAAGAVSHEDSLQMRRMQERGQDVVVTMYMEATLAEPVPSFNLLLDYTPPGAAFPDEYTIVSGHLDSWDLAEGAMDDGGGILSAWEAVRLLATQKIFVNRTIRAIGWVDEESGGVGAQQYGIDYASTFPSTSFAFESDTGAFGIYGLSVTANPDALAQLRALAPLLAPIGAAEGVEIGGDDTDEAVLCSAGVPCAALWPYDPRVGTAANNPCMPYSTELVPPTMPFSVSDGYSAYARLTATRPRVTTVTRAPKSFLTNSPA
jgi:carboxypeptidase Q